MPAIRRARYMLAKDIGYMTDLLYLKSFRRASEAKAFPAKQGASNSHRVRNRDARVSMQWCPKHLPGRFAPQQAR